LLHHAFLILSGGLRSAFKELSLVYFLTPTDEYEGGYFEVQLPCRGPSPINAQPDSMLAFSARQLHHRVTPLRAGHRRSLVLWATARDVSAYEPCVRLDELRDLGAASSSLDSLD